MERVELSKLQKLADGEKIPPLAPEDLPKFTAEVESFEGDLTAAGVAFNAIPFALPDELDPHTLAEGMTGLFYKVRDVDGPILSLLWKRYTAFANDQLSLLPLIDAGTRIAADFDRGLGAGLKNAYHNRQHTVEVLTSAHVLASIDARSEQALPPEGRLLLLLAALIHDWHHDGGVNGGEFFRLEKLALTQAKPYLEGLSQSQRTKLDLAVRTTDVSGPHNYARTALAYQRLCSRLDPNEPRPPAPPAPAGMEAIAALMGGEHAMTVEIAAMLRDADVLPSAGLSADYAALNSSRLRDERAAPYAHADFAAFLNAVLARPRTAYDERPVLAEEKPGMYFAFSSRPAQIFNANIPDVVRGHAKLMEEMGEEPVPQEEQTEEENGVDLSMFEEAKQEAEDLGVGTRVTPEAIQALHTTLKNAGFFDGPPFTLTLKQPPKAVPGLASELINRIAIAEHTADTLQRLHAVSGPVVSALVMHLFSAIGLKSTDGVYVAAMGVARDIDEGKGIGTTDDDPAGERNPYHNHHHIIDMLLLSDMLGQRAAQRAAPASSPLARGLKLLGALVCHWHHTGKGNRVDGQYRHFYLQDHALSFTAPHTEVMSKELRASLEILVRSTDPREPYAFSRLAYNFHVGLGPKPEVPPGCEPLARLLTDPALCTLCARLNDIVFVPFVGLGAAYSAKSIVRLGREIGQPIDFNFVRKNLIGPMLSRPPYPGEKPSASLLVGNNRVASFTSSEAQAIFNPTMHALLVAQAKKSSPSAATPPASPPAPSLPVAAPEGVTLQSPAPATPTPEPAPEPAPEPTPEPEPQPEPQPEPAPEPVPEPVLAPAPEEPVSNPVPLEAIPESVPEPAADPTPEPAPAPQAETEPEPDPEPIATPEPEAQPMAFGIDVPADLKSEPEAEPAPLSSYAQPERPAHRFADEKVPPTASELISQLLAEGLTQPDQSQAFPYFRYHPDPMASNVIKPSDLKCVCCGKVRGFSYFGPVHEATLGEHRICPWCIADGNAHEKLGAVFVDPQPLLEAGINPEIIKEVTRRTPGYQSWQQDQWQVHCKDACAFAGDASNAEALAAPMSLRKAMLEYYDMSEKAWPILAGRYAPGGDPGIYKFSCRHCGQVLFSWDCT